jgi:hypothetical protein
MGHKYGEAFFQEKIDRGFRELGGFFYDGSNIAQPMYQLRGTYGPAKEPDGPEPTGIEPGAEEPHPIDASRGDPGKDDKDIGIERE